ncbi:MAG: efflux RND transporter periplasmic adaptor subunit [Thiotrichales bacterium]|nr:efflux RND transporter periplasmic adaptor subunit [Thiotrichales bacterium]
MLYALFQRKTLFKTLLFSGMLLAGFSSQVMAANTTEQSSSKPAQPAKPLPRVSVLSVTPQTVPVISEVMGRVTAKNLSEIRPQVTGILLSKHFEEGTFVAKGQLLYQIDDERYRADYESALASVAAAKSTLENAKLTVQRNQRIVKINAISEQDVDNSIAAKNTAEAQVLVAQAALKNAQINLDRTQIRAPISGVIGRSLLMPGALVSANQSEALALVQDLDEVYVDYAVPSSVALVLQQTFNNTKTWPEVRLTLSNGQDYSTKGKVVMLDNLVNPLRDTVIVRVAFQNPQQQLLPGLFVKGSFKVGEQANVVLIPALALSRDTQGNALVMTLGDDHKVVPRPVTEDGLYQGQWRVTQGLNPGDQVITKGLQYIRPGAQVQIAPAQMVNSTGAGA